MIILNQMERISMKTKNVTFSLPENIIDMLQSLIGKQKMSSFAASALEKALEEKRELLKKEYAEANNDPDSLKTIDEWRHTDTEGWE